MRRNRAIVLAALLLAVSMSGCLDPFRPIIAPDALGAAEQQWVRTDTDLKSHGALGPNIVETEYRYTPGEDDPDTAGLLLLIGIRTFSKIDTGELLERTREIVDEALKTEGVVVDEEGGRSGERETEGGNPTQWFTLIGTAQSDSPLFAGQEEVRAIGEAWYDGRSKTHVVAVGLAQTTTSNFLGQEQRDHTVWNQIVGDADGTVGGAVNANGFIVHVESHD